MIAEAKALDQRFVEAYNRGDADAVMETYWNSPDLISYAVDTLQLKGWQALKDYTVRTFASMQGASLEILDSNYKPINDFVISWGTWRLTIPSKVGAPVEVVGRYSDVKSQRGGKWVCILDHASVPLPPPNRDGGQ
jgi:ketosteroid isomerase-like protein